jgi:hypothetical protein
MAYAAACPQLTIVKLDAHQKEQSERFKVETIDMRTWQKKPSIEIKGPVYLSLVKRRFIRPLYTNNYLHKSL